MSTPGAGRRASYGPGSPVVGVRGARTRRLLLDSALELFGTRGFHATLVDDIATTAGVSRATLYQYFDSRDTIVTELLEECGAALMRVARRVGPLSGTREGFDNLHWWLGEWSYVYDKFATMFVEWAHIDSPQTPLRPLIQGFVESYTARLASRIAQSSCDLDADQVAIALVTVIERFNYYRHTRETGASDRQMLDTLAVVVQLVLFPQTPWEALALDGAQEADPATVPRFAVGPPVVAPPAQTAPSVEALLEAGARVFASMGYRGSTVDDVLEASGLSRRTFYKYFPNRLDLLLVLSARAEVQASSLAQSFARTGLRTWLAQFVGFHRGPGSVLRIWVEDPADTHESGAWALQSLLDAFASWLAPGPHPPGYDVVAAAWLLLALVERLPHQGVGTRYEMPDGDLVELMAVFVERGLSRERPQKADRCCPPSTAM